MNFKIPLIGSVIIVVLLLIINLIQGNSLLATILRSLVSGVFVYGIIFGVHFVLVEVLKIDLSSSKEDNSAFHSDENKVDLTVNDDFSDENIAENVATRDSEESLSYGDVTENTSYSSSDEASSSDEYGENISSTISSGMNTGIDTSSYGSNDDTEGEYVSPKDEYSSKEKLGFEASPEELAKAIRSKIQKEG